MKIQTQAVLNELKIDNQNILLDEEQPIYLEFSAIDTGGGFKDPMLDFSVSVSSIEGQNHRGGEIMIMLADPNGNGDEINLSYKGEITVAENEINGRITEDELPKEMIRFVFKLFN